MFLEGEHVWWSSLRGPLDEGLDVGLLHAKMQIVRPFVLVCVWYLGATPSGTQDVFPTVLRDHSLSSLGVLRLNPGRLDARKALGLQNYSSSPCSVLLNLCSPKAGGFVFSLTLEN